VEAIGLESGGGRRGNLHVANDFAESLAVDFARNLAEGFT
jgi:hypothetical protein